MTDSFAPPGQGVAPPRPHLRPPTHIAFTPVAVTPRRNGWTPAAQRGFIDALASIGCVTAAARHVGMTPKSAYRLRDRAGAESFAAAWHAAHDTGRCHVHDLAIERALYGETVPVFRGGKQVGSRHRFDNALIIKVLRMDPRFRRPLPAAITKANGS